MRLERGISHISRFRKPVVALGVFDGVHLGHRKILLEEVRKARSIKGTSVVLTFWPLPRRKESLYSLQHRLRLIGELGVQAAIVIAFTKGFARLSAERFVKDVLVGRIHARHVFIGKNFHFGKGREGDWLFLKKLSRAYNFKVTALGIIRKKGAPVSSTLLRGLISKGELSRAKALLARPVSVLGTVVKGESRGATLGFPTANIDPHHEVLPPDGIYAVKVFLKGRGLRGVCYIGKKPTFNKPGAARQGVAVEVHIFNLRKGLYGEILELQFIKKIREDKKFASAGELAVQIEKDVSCAKKVFSRT